MSLVDSAPNKSVLVIRDEPVVRRFFQFANKHGSLTVLIAPNVAEALETCRNFEARIDFVLTGAPAAAAGDCENIRALRVERPNSRFLRIEESSSATRYGRKDPSDFSRVSSVPGRSKEVPHCAASLLAEISEAISKESRGAELPRACALRAAKERSGSLVKAISDKEPLERLTPRETEVLKPIGEGYRTKEIVFRLGITFRTALAHRENSMDKLEIHDAPGLIRFAIRTGVCIA